MSDLVPGLLITIGSFGGVAACAAALVRLSRRNEQTFIEGERKRDAHSG